MSTGMEGAEKITKDAYGNVVDAKVRTKLIRPAIIFVSLRDVICFSFIRSVTPTLSLHVPMLPSSLSLLFCDCVTIICLSVDPSR